MWASPKHLRRSQGRSRCGDAGLHAQAKRRGGRRALGSARKATGQWGGGFGAGYESHWRGLAGWHLSRHVRRPTRSQRAAALLQPVRRQV